MTLPNLVLERLAQALSVVDLASMALVCSQWRLCATEIMHRRVDAAILEFNKARFQRQFQPLPDSVGVEKQYAESWAAGRVFNVAARFTRQPLPDWCVRFLRTHCHYCKESDCELLNLRLRGFEKDKWLSVSCSHWGRTFEHPDVADDVDILAQFASCAIIETGLPHSDQTSTPVCPKQITAPELADVTIKFPQSWFDSDCPGGWPSQGRPGGIWLGNQSYDQISFKAPYFLPSLHHFFQSDLVLELAKFGTLIEDFALDAGLGDGNPLDCFLESNLCEDIVEDTFIALLVRHSNDSLALWVWFEDQLPSLAQHCSADELCEWVHGWHNFYQILNRGDPFQTIPEDVFFERIHAIFGDE